MRLPGHLDAQNLTELSQISEIILRCQRVLKGRDCSRATAADHQANSVHGDHELPIGVVTPNIEARVIANSLETQRDKMVIQLQVPYAWALFQPVQSLVELPHFAGMVRVDKTWRLANINVAIDIPIQESRADVQRVNMVPLVGRDS